MNSYFDLYQVPRVISSSQAESVLRVARMNQQYMLRGHGVLDVFYSAQQAWLHQSEWRERAAACMEKFFECVSGGDRSAELMQLESVAAMLDVDFWKTKIGVELNLSRALDAVHESARSEAILAYRPLGVLLHVCPGNSFMGGLSSVLHGVITGNCNLVKLSRNVPAVLPVVRDLLESCGLPKWQVTCLLWDGGDDDVELPLCRGVDGVAVWGDSTTITRYKSLIPVGVRLLEYGPKLSFSLLTSAARADSEGFARGLAGLVKDACQYEQKSCSSSQVLLLQVKEEPGSDAARMERESLLSTIGSAFTSYCIDHPPSPKNKNQQFEVLKAQEHGKLLKATQRGDVLSGYPDWLIIWHGDEQPIEPSPLFRTLRIYPWRREEEISRRLTTIRHYLQTASVCCAPCELAAISERLWDAGVNRIVAPGRACIASVGAPHDGGAILQGMCRTTSLESGTRSISLWQSGDDDFVLEKIRSQCEVARQSPFYMRRLVQCGIVRRLEDLYQFYKIPRLCKRDFYDYGPPGSSELLTKPLSEIRNCHVFTTGGSTGEPKYAIYSREEFDEVCDIFCRAMQGLGVAAGDRVANLFVSGGLWSAFVAVNSAIERIGCLNLPVGGSLDAVELLHLLSNMRANVLYGVPTTILRLAEAARMHPELKFSPSIILYGGEQMSDVMREYLRETFEGVLIRSAVYAAVDAGAIGYQCRYSMNSEHHVLGRYAYVEICDESSGMPVAPGEVGEIVVTNLSRRTMPVLRLRTGDRGRQLLRTCACGSSNMLFELLGRNDDLIRIAASNVHISDVEKLCSHFPEILSPFYQIRLDRVGVDERYILYMETKSAYNEEHRLMLAARVRGAYLDIAEKLYKSIESGFLRHFELILLVPGSLSGSSRTGKAQRVIDMR